MSGRLGVVGAFNRSRTLNPLHQSNYDEKSHTENASNSASFSKLEKDLKSLKAENAKLQRELNDTQITLKQLITENSHEKFDERRINLLKLQLIQLERQIAILIEALGCRQEAVLEVENAMTWLADRLRSFVAADVKGPLIPIARSDLTTMIEVSESARLKLFKALEGSEKNNVGRDLLFLNPFLGGKYLQGEPLTILDISLQRMDYMNLRHVAQLESKLCKLYKELIRLHDHIQNVKPKALFGGHISSAERNRIETVLLKTCVMLKDSADDLMALSLLCPSSPWPELKRPLTKQVSIERVIAALPALPRSKQEEVKHVIEAGLNTCNHHQFLLTKQMAVLKEELAFHRSVYDLQMQYTQAIFDAVRKGYREFESSAKSLICKPLIDILDAYKCLKNSASEDAFREFLITIKANEEQLTSVVDTFSSQNFDSGSTAFSKFGQEFMDKINSLVRQCQTERDAAMAAHKTVKEEQTKLDVELQHLLEDLEHKYEKIWTPKASETSTSSETRSHLERKDVSSHKDRKRIDIPTEKPDRASNHLTDVQNTSSKLKQHKCDLTALQSSLNNGDDDTCNFESENRYSYQKNMADLDKDDCSLSVKDSTKCSTYDNGKTSKIRWKPDTEWINDFSGLPDKTEELLPPTTDLSEENVCTNSIFQNNNCRISLQTAKNVISNEKPHVKSRQCEYKIKKPLSYEPTLSVANRVLKLKHLGSLSKTDSLQSTHDSSLSKKDGRNLETDTLHIHSQLSQLGSKLPKSEGELEGHGKQKLWR